MLVHTSILFCDNMNWKTRFRRSIRVIALLLIVSHDDRAIKAQNAPVNPPVTPPAPVIPPVTPPAPASPPPIPSTGAPEAGGPIAPNKSGTAVPGPIAPPVAKGPAGGTNGGGATTGVLGATTSPTNGGTTRPLNSALGASAYVRFFHLQYVHVYLIQRCIVIEWLGPSFISRIFRQV